MRGVWSLKWVLVLVLSAMVGLCPVRAADLTPLETRWLHGAAPVINSAWARTLPLDIVVQPQDTPGHSPLALAFVDGRCKLVLSMRGNPQAQQTLDRIAPEWLDAALELMAAHELGHCQRWVDGAWFGLPAGFGATVVPAAIASALAADLHGDLREVYRQMKAVRREEGFGDLIGLAWIHAFRPLAYHALYQWLLVQRSTDRLPGDHHDTLAWIRLAADPAVFDGASLVESASRLWAAGLQAGD
jgi:hypothetical protein